MLFQRKNRMKSGEAPQEEKGLYPVLYVINVLKDYQKDLVRKEVESLQELGMVSTSFSGVLKEADHFHVKLTTLGSPSPISMTRQDSLPVLREILPGL